ncbi:uncharacterized protein [Ptychodera flava]|uniref:uncharacterized protein n=1 Tax=Ptychodera flava TaxID=63121 RepID=UPI00396A620D
MLNLKTVFFSLIGLVAISALLYPIVFRGVFSRAEMKTSPYRQELYGGSSTKVRLHSTGMENSVGFDGAANFEMELTTIPTNHSTLTNHVGTTNIAVTRYSSPTRNLPFGVPYTIPAEKRQAMENRFLYAVVHYDGGPNFQFRQLKIAIQFAVYLNRTLVLPEFKHHRTPYHMGRVSFEETFNVSIFKEFMPVISMQKFREKCGPHISNVIFFSRYFEHNVMNLLQRSYRKQSHYVHEQLNIELPDIKAITFPTSGAEAWHVIDKTRHARCVVMIAPVGFEWVKLPNMAMVSYGMAGHLVRTSLLITAAENILTRLCDGKPILGFHWRNKTGEECRIGHLQKAADSRCHSLLRNQNGIIRRVASHMKSLSKEQDIGCVFVATAPKEPREHVVREISMVTENEPKVLTIDDVINLHNPDVDKFRSDDYFISLLEQELCARSAVFVGIGKSNWSKFLFHEREAFGRKQTYDVTRDFPDLKFSRLYV